MGWHARPGARRPGGIGLLIACALPVALTAAGPLPHVASRPAGALPEAGMQAAAGRLDGEYGLWVHWQGDSLAVSWITRGSTPGFLQVRTGERVRFQTTTPPDSVHSARFPAPADNSFTLRFGGPGDTSETVIRSRFGRPRVSWGAPDSLFVVSDIHGEFDRLTRLLRNAGIVDERLRWAAGRRQLVVVGDVFDRGADATRVLWFLYGLEPQAERAGGRLHLVLGNHEVMAMGGDLRYVAPKETQIARLYGVAYNELFHPQHSALGRWLVSRPALLRIGDVLFAHGGVSADWAGLSLDAVEDSLLSWTGEELFARWSDTSYVVPLDSAGFVRRQQFFWGERGPFWYRGYLQSDSLAPELNTVLQHFDARLHVVGHTPNPGIVQRYGGALIDVNTLPFAAELLLLVRRGNVWQRFRIGETGPPVLLQ
jgi:hypothetical protein